MEQFVGSNYPVFISKHIQESSTETSDYKNGVLRGLMSDFPYGRILLVAETGATAPGELVSKPAVLRLQSVTLKLYFYSAKAQLCDHFCLFACHSVIRSLSVNRTVMGTSCKKVVKLNYFFN